MIKPEVIEQVRTGTDVVELVSGYVALKKVGRNWRGLCPFHTERSPSFYVNPERQTYHCFGCGAGGSVINFVMAIEKLEFPEAVKFLGKRLGIRVESDKPSDRSQALYDVCELACQFYEQQLGRSTVAQEYLKRRGLGAETVRRFRLGFAPGGNRLRGEAKRKGWSEDVLVQAGLLAVRDNGLADYFYDRLMFPVFSLSGRVIAFGGRVLDATEPKYLNSPESPIFRKGDNLYGLFQAKGYLRNEVPIVVEGNFDLLSVVDAGLNNVVAPLGTALTPQQAQVLRRYNDRAIIMFDGDAAGRKAAARAIAVLLAAGIEPGIVTLPAGEDPDSYVRKHGKERFAATAAEANDFVDHLLSNRSLKAVSAQKAALQELVSLVRLIPDPAARELYRNRIAKRFGVDKSVLVMDKVTVAASRRPPVGTARIEERLVAAAVQDAELARIAREHMLVEFINEPDLQKVLRIVFEECDRPAFGAGAVLELIEDVELRRRVASWTVTESVLPTPAEYRERVRRTRANWLHRRILAAAAAGDDGAVAVLTSERHSLLREIARERSSRQ